MPLVDKPLHELKNYYGISPCPIDMDEYWENTLNKMREIDPNVIIRPAKFSCEYSDCYDLWFTGLGGSRIHCKYLLPKGKTKPFPALIKFHGYTYGSGDWSEHLAHVAAGYVVVAMDCRGQGGESEDIGGSAGNTIFGCIVRGADVNENALYYKYVYCDTAQIANIVMNMEHVNAERVYVYGGSQGGALALACASLETRIKKVFSVYPFLCDFKRVWELDVSTAAYGGIKEYLRRFDPLHERTDIFFTRLGYIDIQNLVGRIEAQVTMVTGLMDITCPPSTQFAAYNKIVSKKEMVIYPDFGHEIIPGISDRLMQDLLRFKCE